MSIKSIPKILDAWNDLSKSKIMYLMVCLLIVGAIALIRQVPALIPFYCEIFPSKCRSWYNDTGNVYIGRQENGIIHVSGFSEEPHIYHNNSRLQGMNVVELEKRLNEKDARLELRAKSNLREIASSEGYIGCAIRAGTIMKVSNIEINGKCYWVNVQLKKWPKEKPPQGNLVCNLPSKENCSCDILKDTDTHEAIHN